MKCRIRLCVDRARAPKQPRCADARPDSDLQPVVRDRHRAVFDRERRPEVPTWDRRNAARQPRADVAHGAGAFAHDGPVHALVQARRFGARADPSTETRAAASAGLPARYRISASKSSSVSPGNPTMTSAVIEAWGMRAAHAGHDTRRTPRMCTGRRIARSMRSLACCSGRWKAGTRRSPDAARSISAGVQSIGSSDPRRKRSVRVPADDAPPGAHRASRADRGRGHTSPDARPSASPLVPRGLDALQFLDHGAHGVLRSAPRVDGITQ